jgi:hypothetical protein
MIRPWCTTMLPCFTRDMIVCFAPVATTFGWNSSPNVATYAPAAS